MLKPSGLPSYQESIQNTNLVILPDLLYVRLLRQVCNTFCRLYLNWVLLQGGLVFVCGSREGLMCVSGRRHNTDDIIATVLAVEPNRFIYRGRIAVFSTPVLKDERICIVAEQRPDCSEEEVCLSSVAKIFVNPLSGTYNHSAFW